MNKSKWLENVTAHEARVQEQTRGRPVGGGCRVDLAGSTVRMGFSLCVKIRI